MKVAEKMESSQENSQDYEEVRQLRKKVGNDQIKVVEIAELEAKPLGEMFGFWNKARNGLPLPCSSCIDPVALPKSLSQLFVLKIDRDPLRFWFRIVGEDVINAFGENVAGQEVSKIVSGGEATGKLLHATYSWVLKQGKPIAMAGPNGALQDGFKRHEMIYLPFSNGGCQITNILGGSVYYRT